MEKREIKFRAWDEQALMMSEAFEPLKNEEPKICGENINKAYAIYMQYTGLKDRNGKEIYEMNEINKKFRVVYKFNRYILQCISNSAIFEEINENGQYEITGEYCPLA